MLFKFRFHFLSLQTQKSSMTVLIKRVPHFCSFHLSACLAVFVYPRLRTEVKEVKSKVINLICALLRTFACYCCCFIYFFFSEKKKHRSTTKKSIQIPFHLHLFILSYFICCNFKKVRK